MESGDFKDEFRIQVMKHLEKKAKAGEGKTVVEPEEEAPQSGDEVIVLTALLKRSLKGGAKDGAKAHLPRRLPRSTRLPSGLQ